ncbi:hypothetical protein N7E02_26885 [Aliirhizobium terrae]|uniref:hypothetical protein n=1 Tax=Terrirhizobium terrae TaxID=2926709 RepID=UPI002578F41D|nr:hypothetical protein [Rhizobium sp. CC-CFT758]WJH40200.1 hypothetical protein N7E02_26885 [Rhizobium sp. CC-CFT758]
MPTGSVDHVSIHYVKSSYFRVIYADGFFGGPTPSGNLRLAPYSDRQKMPGVTRLPVDERGNATGPEVSDDDKFAVDRSVECDLIMDFNATVNLFLWLESRVRELGVIQGLSPEQIDEILKLKRETSS